MALAETVTHMCKAPASLLCGALQEEKYMWTRLGWKCLWYHGQGLWSWFLFLLNFSCPMWQYTPVFPVLER